MKKCSVCLIEKTKEEFHLKRSSKDGLCHFCKVCNKVRKAAEYQASRDKVLARVAAYRKENPEKVKQAKAAAYAKKPEQYKAKWKADYQENREQWLIKFSEYREANKEKINARNVKYVRNRLARDPLFKLTYQIRNRIFIACRDRRITKGTKTMELIGCDWQTLKIHLENQFKPGMSWENRSSWHIDHKKPLASAKTPEELFALCHYTNLQPLWATENIKKGAKLDYQQPMAA